MRAQDVSVHLRLAEAALSLYSFENPLIPLSFWFHPFNASLQTLLYAQTRLRKALE